MLRIIDSVLGFDTETTGLWPWPTVSRDRLGLAADRPFLFQLANTDGEVVSFRARVNPRTRAVSYDHCKSELKWLRGVVANPKLRVVCHNAQFERRMTTQLDLAFDWRCAIDDTRIMARVCNPTTEWQGYGLKPLAQKYLDIPVDDQKALSKELNRARLRAKKRGWAIATKASHGQTPAAADYWLPELETLVKTYGEMDAIRTIGLWMMYRQILADNRDSGGKLEEVYGWEQRMMLRAMKMERYGMTYLHAAGTDLRRTYTDYMQTQRQQITTLGYPTINLQSSNQMRDVFVVQKGYHVSELTKTGYRHLEAGTLTRKEAEQRYPKIDAEQLMAWARGSSAGADVDGDGPDGCKLSRATLEWKAGKKVLEYIDSYEFFSCRRLDGSFLLHPSWDPAGARTGRFACKDPNTQQIASAETSRRHSHIRARQRECFGPRPNYLWYMPDYSQIEVWIFAFAANEQAMMDALLAGEDFHLSTAGAAWRRRPNFCTCGVDPHWERRTSRELHQKGCFIKWWRQRAKMLLFSRLYGGGIKKVAYLIRCSVKEAQEFVDEFNENLPGVKRYMDRLVEEVRESGRLVNLFGREYQIDRDKAYKAVNYMVQGSAAEVMKRSLVRVGDYFDRRFNLDTAGRFRPRANVVGTVHDELIAEVHRSLHSASLMRKIIELMQKDSHKIPNLPVPLPVGMKYTTTNWSAAKEVTILRSAA